MIVGALTGYNKLADTNFKKIASEMPIPHSLGK